jgi:hypothetical protein
MPAPVDVAGFIASRGGAELQVHFGHATEKSFAQAENTPGSSFCAQKQNNFNKFL